MKLGASKVLQDPPTPPELAVVYKWSNLLRVHESESAPIRRTNMLRKLIMSIALVATTIGAFPASFAADYGGVVLGRRTGPDGALLIAPAATVPGRSGYVIGNPVLSPGPDVRYGPYGRPAPGYGGIYYGAIPGTVYGVPNQDRMYCPESRAYYPAVQDCATPWLRMRPGGGVTADSPIPMPNSQPYGR
jgi:hypothetical protein